MVQKQDDTHKRVIFCIRVTWGLTTDRPFRRLTAAPKSLNSNVRSKGEIQVQIMTDSFTPMSLQEILNPVFQTF